MEITEVQRLQLAEVILRIIIRGLHQVVTLLPLTI